MRILVAPDSFKDSLSSRAVCDQIAKALRDQSVKLDLCPLGDGGEGSGRLLAEATRCDLISETVRDPLGRNRTATWFHQPDREHGIVEMAEASGLMLLAPDERNPLRTTSYGTGQLLQAALDRGCKTIQLCIGGSATVDGGVGCLQALGWTFWNKQQQVLQEPLTGGDLERLGGFGAPLSLPEANIEILCDVTNPLLGPSGAAPVFGPQKGADPGAVAQLERGLHNLAVLLCAQTGWDVAERPGSGAAGGMAAGMFAALEAGYRPGFAAIAEAVDLTRRLQACDWVITGEGRLDAQSTGGKVIGSLLERARAAGKPVAVVAGSIEQLPGDVRAAEELAPDGVTPEILRDAPGRLAAASRRLLETMRRLSC